MFIVRTLAEALVPTIMGLFVAITSVWLYNHFTERLKTLQQEMANASLELLTLVARPDVAQQRATEEGQTVFAGWEGRKQSWQVGYDSQALILWPMLLFGAYLGYQLVSAMYWSYVFERQYAEYHSEVIDRSERIPQQVVYSPDRRFRAVIPRVIRESLRTEDGRKIWTCTATVSFRANDEFMYSDDLWERATFDEVEDGSMWFL